MIHVTKKPPRDPLTDAARAYADAKREERAALDAVLAARRRRAEVGKQVEAVRAQLADEIVKAARAGAPPRDIVARSEGVYTRENIRKICNLAGVEPVE